MGFNHTTITWIMSCVTSETFVVLVNGEPSSFFHSGRGLWQGFPLSPLLFILCHGRLKPPPQKNPSRRERITGIKVSRLVKILHLLFV
jgi:hypothetical protein